MPSVQTALVGKHRVERKKAMGEEFEALCDHKTFSIVPRPVGYNVISTKFVLKLKRGPSNEIIRFKARYVARGFSQIEGIDFFQTYSLRAIIRPSLVRSARNFGREAVRSNHHHTNYAHTSGPALYRRSVFRPVRNRSPRTKTGIEHHFL